MAQIELRAYVREIAGLIERGAHAEAIAHCRHVLRIFPKHLETYRLLGKAYLEAKRYDEAADILERVALAAPDDFVSHVGLSIVADERGDLNAAIWHMQRAFEAQPSNPAIQSELQRLFGRRDGLEPPKIRMTRGALAHMYMQGELYPQAIAEIRAVLGQDSQRTDLKVLLAQAYFRAGQSSEAADVCADLLRDYPFSMDANRIMTGIFPPDQGNESREVYRRRVIELDPYAAFSTEPLMRSDGVADSQVLLDRFEAADAAAEAKQNWAPPGALGVREDRVAAERAHAAAPESPQAAATHGQPVGTTGAGLAQGEGGAWPDHVAADGAEEAADLAEAAAAAAGLVPAELPAWLRDKMPAEEPSWELGSEGLGAADGAMPDASADSLGIWAVQPPLSDASTGDEAGGNLDQQDAGGEVPSWLRDLGAQGADSYAQSTPYEGSNQPMAEAAGEEEPLPIASAGGNALEARAEHGGDVLGWLDELASGDTLARSGTDGEGDLAAHLDMASEAGAPAPEEAAAKGQAAEPSVPAEASTVEWLRSLEDGGADSLVNDLGGAQDGEPFFAAPEAVEWLWSGDTAESATVEGPAGHPGVDEGAGSPVSPQEQPAKGDVVAGEPTMADEVEAVGNEQPVPDLAEWLAGLDASQATEDKSSLAGELAGWAAEEPKPTAATPTAPSDWQPAESGADATLSDKVRLREPEPAEGRGSMDGRPADQATLSDAQRAMQRGEVVAALEMYALLIRKGRFLDDTLRDLREMVYRFPVDFGLWQTLGDAYMRANRLQEALDAYNKAEELIR